MKKKEGYTLIILMIAIAVLSIGLLVAVPVWRTQIQREKEEELIFRGKQYVEAIRLYQMKYPGSFPRSLEELVEEKCIRKLYNDLMSQDGEWNIILVYRGGLRSQRELPRKEGYFQKVLVIPHSTLSSIDNPQIIGIVSSSKQNSIKIYNGQETYNHWLFFYGQDPKKMPEIIYYGQTEKE